MPTDSRGDPMSPLSWTCKSLRALASRLGAFGHEISHTVVGELLKAKGFSLHANRKPRKARIARTGTPSSPSSTGRQKRRWPNGDR